jgi:hypothetical protein
MKRVIAILVVLLGVGLIGGFAVTASEDESVSLPEVAKKIQQGKIDVGGKANKAFGMAQDQRFHRIHASVLGLECATCHTEQLPPSVAPFTERPAVDVSAKSLGLTDRRVCLGCHTAGPGRHFYGPQKP